MSCCCFLMFCPKAESLCLVYSRRESYLLNSNIARTYLYGRAPDSFQTENSYIVGIETGISVSEVPILTTELRRLSACLNRQLKTKRVLIDNGKIEHISNIDSSGNQKFFIYKRTNGQPAS